MDILSVKNCEEGKRMHPSFAVALQITKTTVILCDKCLHEDKKKKALNLYNRVF